MEKENGFADTNAAELNKNVANYAPGVQDTNLTNAQGSRAATMTGNITPDAGADVPYTADALAPVRSELAKRIMAAHDGAVSRAGLTAKVGGYGDTWFNNDAFPTELANADDSGRVLRPSPLHVFDL